MSIKSMLLDIRFYLHSISRAIFLSIEPGVHPVYERSRPLKAPAALFGEPRPERCIEKLQKNPSAVRIEQNGA